MAIVLIILSSVLVPLLTRGGDMSPEGIMRLRARYLRECRHYKIKHNEKKVHKAQTKRDLREEVYKGYDLPEYLDRDSSPGRSGGGKETISQKLSEIKKLSQVLE
jgi:hypothetical protein